MEDVVRVKRRLLFWSRDTGPDQPADLILVRRGVAFTEAAMATLDLLRELRRQDPDALLVRRRCTTDFRLSVWRRPDPETRQLLCLHRLMLANDVQLPEDLINVEPLYLEAFLGQVRLAVKFDGAGLYTDSALKTWEVDADLLARPYDPSRPRPQAKGRQPDHVDQTQDRRTRTRSAPEAT